jgi:hypothetical protein
VAAFEGLSHRETEVNIGLPPRRKVKVSPEKFSHFGIEEKENESDSFETIGNLL